MDSVSSELKTNVKIACHTINSRELAGLYLQFLYFRGNKKIAYFSKTRQECVEMCQK